MKNICLNIDRLQTAIRRTMRKLGPELAVDAELGLTGPQFYILHLLAQKEKCMVRELADEMGVKPSAITVMIDRLIKHGYVLRYRDENDRRIVWIQLSHRGHQVLTLAESKRQRVVSRYLQYLNPEELSTLVTLHEKLAAIVTEKSQDESHAQYNP